MTDAFYYTPEDDKIYILDYDVWHYVMPECHQYSGRGAIIPNGEGASAEDPRAPYTYAVVIDAGSNIYFSI